MNSACSERKYSMSGIGNSMVSSSVWGYQPWRFLIFVVLPLILVFACIWYWFYYEIVMGVVDNRIDQKYASRNDKPHFSQREIHLFGSKKGLFPPIEFKVYDHPTSSFGTVSLLRYWHVTFFSASVLLGIRIKKEWIQIIPPTSRLGQKSFIIMMSIEWLLGIGLYVAFAVLVKGSRFEFIKGLLGF